MQNILALGLDGLGAVTSGKNDRSSRHSSRIRRTS